MAEFDADIYSDGLYRIAEAVAGTGAKQGARGFLGGEFGYGARFDNEVFTTRPYFWDDCDCGFDKQEWDWVDANPHADDCYQAELKRREEAARSAGKSVLGVAYELAEERGMPERGCAVHCTCSRAEKYREWREANGHTDKCSPFLPNFHHKASGLKINFYKYIGRRMYANQELEPAAWEKIVDECIASLPERKNP